MLNPALAICPVQPECGGCGLLGLAPPEQHQQKLLGLRAALSAQGLLAASIPLVASPEPLAYRNRLRLALDAGHVRFFNPHKVLSCAVLEPGLSRGLSELFALSHARPELFLAFEHLELRSADDDGYAGLALATRRPSGAADQGEALARLALALPRHRIGCRGDPEIACQRRGILDGVWAYVPLDGFWQVNSGVNRALVRRVLELCQRTAARSALDLYAGAGNFSLPLAARGLTVSAVELGPSAARALGRAAREQGLACTALAESAEGACERLARAGCRFDCIVLDAPRAGARGALAPLLRLAPRAIAVCSCNPASLARDLARLSAGGYRLAELEAFDMFPHTEHLEVLAWLERA